MSETVELAKVVRGRLSARDPDQETSILENHDNSPRSLARVLGVFDAIAHTADGMTLARLSAELDSPKSSLLTLLRPLVGRGYLTHDGGAYRLGPAIFRAGPEREIWPPMSRARDV